MTTDIYELNRLRYHLHKWHTVQTLRVVCLSVLVHPTYAPTYPMHPMHPMHPCRPPKQCVSARASESGLCLRECKQSARLLIYKQSIFIMGGRAGMIYVFSNRRVQPRRRPEDWHWHWLRDVCYVLQLH